MANGNDNTGADSGLSAAAGSRWQQDWPIFDLRCEVQLKDFTFVDAQFKALDQAFCDQAGTPIPSDQIVCWTRLESYAEKIEKLEKWAKEAAQMVEQWALDDSIDLTRQMPGCRAMLESCPVHFHSENTEHTDASR
jgi:hypothetical protein